MALAVRPDLSQRTMLSKSALVSADLCGSKAWYEIHDRKPLIPSEKITFGSCLDAGVEQILTAVRAGIPATEAHPLDAAEEVMARDGIDIDLAELDRALSRFLADVLPRYDWALCGLQVHLTEELAGLGTGDGHPDIRLHDGSIFDVKSASRAKSADAAATSVELGFYGLLSEAETKVPTPRVGYLTWCRTARPSWQVLEAPFTDEMRRRTRAQAAGYVRAKAADELLNRNVTAPINFTFPSGPRNVGLCGTCQYNPAFGGPCQLAVQEGITDDAA